MASITMKVGNMRKEAEFTLYPYNGTGKILVQSDKRIAEINLETGVGIISTNTSAHPSFSLLQHWFKPLTFDCPTEVLQKIKGHLSTHAGKQTECGGVLSYVNAEYKG